MTAIQMKELSDLLTEIADQNAISDGYYSFEMEGFFKLIEWVENYAKEVK